MPVVLDVQNLKKTFGKKKPFTAVDGISFSLKSGEILGLLGPNGSGKTTTIQMLLGTLAVTSGTIYYFDKDFLQHRLECLQQISFASTYVSLPHPLTVGENLKCFGRLYGIRNALEKAMPLLERFGMEQKIKTTVGSLSAGQITRLMLIKAFLSDPKVVLLDEPTASLDPDIAQDVCAFLMQQRAKTGLSILFTSHKMEEVAQVCDRVVVLQQGKVIANDIPKNLAKSTHAFRLHVTIIEGMEKALAITEEEKLDFKIENRILSCSMDESKIPYFLNRLMQASIVYTSLQIEEPTLEDYFLTIAGKKR